MPRPNGYLLDTTNTMASCGRLVVWMHSAFADKYVYVRNDKELIGYSPAK